MDCFFLPTQNSFWDNFNKRQFFKLYIIFYSPPQNNLLNPWLGEV